MYERRGVGWCSEEDFECVLILLVLKSTGTSPRYMYDVCTYIVLVVHVHVCHVCRRYVCTVMYMNVVCMYMYECTGTGNVNVNLK